MIVSSLDHTPVADAPQIRLELDGRQMTLLVRRRTSTRSPHTGREMEELHGWMTTSDAGTHRWLSEVLRHQENGRVRAYDQAGEFAGHWTVSWNAYSEKSGVHTYTLILRECEELNLEALLLGEVELHPYEYREEVSGEGLILWAKLVGTGEDVARLRGLAQERRLLPVVRRGIQDQPREMRLSLAEWSEYEDRVKYRLVLVEKGVDDGAHPELARIERENSRAALGFYMNFAERLVELLVHKGVLTPAEVEAVREEASALPSVVRHDFWHVITDIDEL